MQTRKQSLIEASLNTFSGMMLAFAISQIAMLLAPYIREYLWSSFIWDVSPGSNAVMTIILTIVSIVRSYYWRRHFNRANR